MHRTKTRFAARVNHVATALERRGVRATYALPRPRPLELDEPGRFGPHARARRRPATSPRRARRRGLLAPDVRGASPWKRRGARSKRSRAIRRRPDTEAALAGDREGLRVRAGKEFVVRLHSYGVEVGLDDAWLSCVRLAQDARDLANTYLGLWSKLEYVDMWYSVPQAADEARVASQRWHRDFNDKHLLKAFLYLVDVDEGTGPFQYVPGSAPEAATATRGRSAPSARTTRPRASSSSAFRLRTSRRSPARRARCSSAIPRASTAAVSRP